MKIVGFSRIRSKIDQGEHLIAVITADGRNDGFDLRVRKHGVQVRYSLRRPGREMAGDAAGVRADLRLETHLLQLRYAPFKRWGNRPAAPQEGLMIPTVSPGWSGAGLSNGLTPTPDFVVYSCRLCCPPG